MERSPLVRGIACAKALGQRCLERAERLSSERPGVGPGLGTAW